MARLTNLTPAEKKFLDDAVAAAERASGKKLNQPNRHIVLNRARAQIELQRYADRQRALREDGVSLDIENYCTVSLFFEQTYL
ncbi:hypothetical protein ACVUSQ_24110 [Escherichia coli]|uniref:hypothetical protein n=1 Tax=Escherichia coli TaxID=562 RepID=UPI00208DBBA4|nr:hypothetical protein [Escherichia coli]